MRKELEFMDFLLWAELFFTFYLIYSLTPSCKAYHFIPVLTQDSKSFTELERSCSFCETEYLHWGHLICSVRITRGSEQWSLTEFWLYHHLAPFFHVPICKGCLSYLSLNSVHVVAGCRWLITFEKAKVRCIWINLCPLSSVVYNECGILWPELTLHLSKVYVNKVIVWMRRYHTLHIRTQDLVGPHKEETRAWSGLTILCKGWRLAAASFLSLVTRGTLPAVSKPYFSVFRMRVISFPSRQVHAKWNSVCRTPQLE